MSYTALYRKFRPLDFDDVKGQDHITTTLKNQIKANRIGHAYLFCGTRGTGKTSIAKILARAVNCESPIDSSPCNKCSMCKAINSQASMNVIEIDAASNNGVDNIREIIDEVQYSPTEGRYKVYIIDEVHMLSAGAFNALLKTLEEPPSYVIFILATTEAHKIPITILSRCQRYDFKRITIEVIARRLTNLMQKEEVEAEDKALKFIAKAADGSMRDALSLLDQCIAFNFGEKLTYDNVLGVLGAVDIEVFSKMLKNILNQAVIGCIELLEELIIEGRELGQFVVDFTWYLRNLLLVKTSDEDTDIIDASSEHMTLLRREATLVDSETLMRYIRIFSELSNEVKYASQKRVMVEIALIKLCKPAMETNYDSILNRISLLEKQIENGLFVQKEVASEQSSSKEKDLNSIQLPKSSQENKKKEALTLAIPEDLKEVARNWDKIIKMTSGPTMAMLRDAVPSVGNVGNEENASTLLIGFRDKVDEGFLKSEHLQELTDIIANEIGKKVTIQVKFIEKGNSSEDEMLDLTKIIKNMDIEYVE